MIFLVNILESIYIKVEKLVMVDTDPLKDYKEEQELSNILYKITKLLMKVGLDKKT